MRDHRSPPSTGTRVAVGRLLLAAAAGLAAAPARAAEPPPAAVLHLSNGGFVPGDLNDSARPGVLRWRSPSFAAPFDFGLDAVNAVHYPPPVASPKPEGAYCFELSGGDVVFGTLVGLDDQGAELDVPRAGRLHVRRANLVRVYRWRDSADLVYLGPNGMAGWHEPGSRKGWREESGALVADKAGVTARGDLGLPARAAVEFEVSWKERPDFILALGVDDTEASARRAFRFEVWDGDLVVQRETETEADVSSVGKIAPGPGRAHLLAYLDQDAARILVFSTGGKPLADLTVNGRRRPALTGVSLANNRGDVRLERLRVSRWNGEPPREARADRSRVHLADGSIVYGQVTRFDAGSKEFVVRGESGETRVAEGRVAALFLPAAPDDDRPRAVRAVYQDGTRLSGDLVKVEGGALWLTVPGVKEPSRLPLAGLRSLVVLRHEAAPPARDAHTGTLELDGVRLLGRLADGGGQPGSSRLAWQPLGSATASPLRPGVSGRVIYREPPSPPSLPPQPPGGRVRVQRVPQPAQPVGIVQGFFHGLTDSPTPPSAARRSLHLRTGDVIPSDVTAIDETGVSFRTPLSDSTFVPHDKVKAVELAPETAVTVRLNKPKRERLLTLPRMQKDSPPTHLIRSKNGDYLRGRVVKMDGKTLQVEVRLETKDVPRDRVSRIIWLHADETDPAKSPAKPPEAGAPTRVQALRRDGTRLTFAADRLAGDTLSGKSDVLGACRVRLDDVDQLLIGGAIETAAARLAYQQWKLRNAEEPKTAQADGGPSTTGAESAMVGKPAPDFALDLLGGKTFRLSETRGEVVVLDFWATWCGPCLQAMPQVDRVTQEFRDQGVRLVAVNLQEAPDQISATLERHKLRLTVALDRDGAVAEKYGANAIPQTVIIGRDGTVARLFVGGGPHFDDALRDALRAVVAGGPEGAKK